MKTIKVAVVHNTYQQAGGEDMVVAAETALLERRGHKVVRYTRSNDEITAMSRPEKLFMVKNLIHSDKSKRELRALLQVEKPDVVHVHNTFLMMSPSIYEACCDAGIPVIQTLHNYRLLCPGWSLSRNGEVCEECLDRGLWRGIVHGCYRDSRLMTAAVALMLQVHRSKGTWHESIDSYVALTRFARAKFIQGGLPGSSIHVKPNFLADDPGVRQTAGRNALYIGRLSTEKGVGVLLDAWRKLNRNEQLIILGDGPLRHDLEAKTDQSQLGNVAFAGWKPRAQIFAAIKNAAFVVLPSLSYEGFPMTLVEAFACGTPVICSDRGGLPEIVNDGATGLHFKAGDADDLANKMEWAWNHSRELAAMGLLARQEFEKKYTADANYTQLLQIYEKSLARSEAH